MTPASDHLDSFLRHRSRAPSQTCRIRIVGSNAGALNFRSLPCDAATDWRAGKTLRHGHFPRLLWHRLVLKSRLLWLPRASLLRSPALQDHFHRTKGHLPRSAHRVPHTTTLAPTHSRLLDSPVHSLGARPTHLPSKLLLTRPWRPIAAECASPHPIPSGLALHWMPVTLPCETTSLFLLWTVYTQALVSPATREHPDLITDAEPGTWLPRLVTP